jgi:hypothetical protein
VLSQGAAAVGQHRDWVRRVSPVARSHSRSVRSKEPERW